MDSTLISLPLSIIFNSKRSQKMWALVKLLLQETKWNIKWIRIKSNQCGLILISKMKNKSWLKNLTPLVLVLNQIILPLSTAKWFRPKMIQTFKTSSNMESLSNSKEFRKNKRRNKQKLIASRPWLMVWSTDRMVELLTPLPSKLLQVQTSIPVLVLIDNLQKPHLWFRQALPMSINHLVPFWIPLIISRSEPFWRRKIMKMPSSPVESSEIFNKQNLQF